MFGVIAKIGEMWEVLKNPKLLHGLAVKQLLWDEQVAVCGVEY